MNQVDQIGYKTTLADIKRMVLKDFGQTIDDYLASVIMHMNNLSALRWTDKEISAASVLVINKEKLLFNRDGIYHITGIL